MRKKDDREPHEYEDSSSGDARRVEVIGSMKKKTEYQLMNINMRRFLTLELYYKRVKVCTQLWPLAIFSFVRRMMIIRDDDDSTFLHGSGGVLIDPQNSHSIRYCSSKHDTFCPNWSGPVLKLLKGEQISVFGERDIRKNKIERVVHNRQ